MTSDDRLLSRQRFDAVIFDLDGVVTDTASAHLRAWKETFDELLRRRLGDDYEPFGSRDYRRLVDGKPRLDGIRSFVQDRGIEVPEGEADEPAGYGSVAALAKEKNRRYHRHLEKGAVEVFDDTVDLVETLREAGFEVAIVSSSRNAQLVLELADLEKLFDERVDGITLAESGLKGKPAPDMFLEAARRLGVAPERTVVVEDAESGVAAGRAGNFGLVVGLSGDVEDRARLRESGADVAVGTMADFEVEG